VSFFCFLFELLGVGDCCPVLAGVQRGHGAGVPLLGDVQDVLAVQGRALAGFGLLSF
jgi:hypothetical protein